MRTCTLILMLPALAIATLAGDRDWANFRGPDVTGVATGTLFSGKANVGLKEAWRTSIGSGYAGVVVQGDTAVTAFKSGEHDVLAAFDAGTGKERWRLTLEETYVGHDGSHDGPLMTPTIAGNRVFALGARGRFVAADLASGRLLWEADLTEQYQSNKPHYGYTSSPVVRDGVLVMQLGADDAAVAGFDPETGKRLWTAGGEPVDYQSPVPFRFGGREQIVAACRTKLYAVDARSGELFWEHPHEGNGGTGMMSIVPVVTGPDTIFLAHKEDGCCALKFTSGEEGVKVETLWENRAIRKSYNVPIHYEGYLYAYSSRFLTCVDAATGETMWRSREPGDGFMSLADGHLVLATKDGGLHVVKATPDAYEHVAGVELFENLCWNSVAIANGSIYIRSLDELARIDVTGAAPAMAARESGDPRTQFAAFLNQVAEAENKQQQVDQFIASVKQFPLIEGNSLVHFLYKGPARDVAVGSELFGARQERAMTHVAGTDLWYLSVPIEPDARVNYVLLTDFETGVDPRNDRTCKSILYGPEMEMNFRQPFDMSWFAMPDWNEPTYLAEAAEAKRGKVESHELDSEKLAGKAPFEVYLPAGYPQSGVRYPVAYLHGGRGARAMGNLTNALDNLCGDSVAPLIVVMINAQSRGRSEAYGEMVATELVPFIDKTYQTDPRKEARANVGQGFAGMDAIMTGLTHTDVFSKLGVQSGFAFGTPGSTDEVIAGAAGKPVEIYLEWSKYDLRNPHEAWDLAQVNRDMADTFRKHGFSPKGGEVPIGSDWANWSGRLHAVFGSLFPLNGKSPA